ncbi:MAG: transporter substrate-binding domain-containing protein [Erysipelotrichaceae bacterium]|nr:transporter substrate-binding domain-containing protein [Erysipelotrichaceae bacterium]
MLISLPVSLSAASRTVVRLGYYERPGFMEGMSEKDRKTGYAYDYLQRISDYTGWQYEYVYASEEELYEMMFKGEVDIIAGVAPDESLLTKMEYSNQPLGRENCNIYKLQSDDSINPGYIASFIGKNIGVIEGNIEETYLEEYLEENVVSCIVKKYADKKALQEAVEYGEVDAFVAFDRSVSKVPNITSCLTIEQNDYYVCVSPSKRTLLREFNEADAQLRVDDPHFLEDLYSQYYENEIANLNQTKSEQVWLQLNSNLRIGYIRGYLPFCDEDKNGQVTGLLKDYIDTLKKQPELKNLNIEAIPYDNIEDCYKDLQSGTIHVMFPDYQDVWYAEGQGLRNSSLVFSQPVDLIFKGQYSDSVTKKIALSTSSPLKGYIKRLYPDAKIVECDSLSDCIEAVKNGKATATLMNRYKSSQYLQQSGNQNLRSVSSNDASGLVFSVKSADVELLSLINRGVRLMGSEEIDKSVNKYVYYDFDYSLSSFLAANIGMVVAGGLLFVLFLILVFAYYIYTTKKHERKMQKAQDELNEAKNQLTEALEQADFANKSKTTFLFNMSHDIRTPMNAILGFAGLLEKHDDEPEKRHHYVENIKTAGGYLLDLINEVLEMSRIESGKATLNETEGDYIEMLDAVEVVLGNECAKKDHQFVKEINIEHKDLFFDFTKERTIFLNVISNAIKYTPNGGKITLTVNEIPGAEGTVIVESIVEDTGVGMAEEFLPHIFDSFSREKSATESKIIGTGLGMGIVKCYVELMGGTIDVQSKLNVGTKITTRIPHRIGYDYADIKASEIMTGEMLAGKNVLLAEDNELNQEIAMEILKEVGLTVSCAFDGEECVNILKESEADTFDFILMDIQMPNMDGLSATETIRKLEDKAKANIPIIAMTANVFDTDKKRAYEVGMDGFTGKPIQINELITELNRVLSDRKNGETK